MPPIAPDGLPNVPKAPVRLTVVAPPTLCDQGPCVHLHTVTMPYDAATPMDGSEQREFRATVRTCYPHPGIEAPMNGTVILQCNRWTPSDPIRNAGIERNRVAYLQSPAGHAYAAQLAAWEVDQANIDAAAVATVDEGLELPPDKEHTSIMAIMIALNDGAPPPPHEGKPDIIDDGQAGGTCPDTCPRCALQAAAMEQLAHDITENA